MKTTIGTYERWAVEDIIVKENVRKQFDEEGLRRHAESLKRDGQLRPLVVLRDRTLVAGERSLRAMKLAGITHADVKVLDGEVSPGEIKRLQLIENLLREGLTDAEVYRACKEIAAESPDRSKKELAADMRFDPSMMPRILSVDDLIPEAKEAFLNGEFGFSKAYAIKKAGEEEEQRRMLAAIRSGSSRDEVERQSRKARQGQAQAVHLSRVKIPMSQATVVITGKELGMSEIVQLLAETLQEARKAAKRYDVKKWQSAMRDRAKRVSHAND
ncbi:MAG TPA: ParB/RepB/Spo0J family partition protein [Pirellulales bacterium]|nr:ParB/RepB/Spo0J family partition protein [Pirellulales bacterium]